MFQFELLFACRRHTWVLWHYCVICPYCLLCLDPILHHRHIVVTLLALHLLLLRIHLLHHQGLLLFYQALLQLLKLVLLLLGHGRDGRKDRVRLNFLRGRDVRQHRFDVNVRELLDG